ncbi:hypothetical protein EST38_g8470 [Candolleomyces aberdarensis]|uniref:Uncharacterized protein n=1 Tax=Candolleomyces aberdarensis TaxID=2316362 RepID=A0A4Q2DCD4_9AGAR|nr:hypothetical protein EST38_g8470 [Candolleomyces aberdarensis]
MDTLALWNPPPAPPPPPQQQQQEEEEEDDRDDDPLNHRYRHVSKISSAMSNRRQMVQLWLTRAGMTDLSISIVNADTSNADTHNFSRRREKWTKHSVEIVNILVQYSAQLAVLDLGISPQRAKPILGLPPSKVPRLRSLRLCHHEYYDLTESKASTGHAIVGSPNINSLRVAIPAPVIDGTRVQWGNLIDLALTIESGSWNENPNILSEFLSTCQSLVVLSVVISYDPRTNRDHGSTVVSIPSTLYVHFS